MHLELGSLKVWIGLGYFAIETKRYSVAYSRRDLFIKPDGTYSRWIFERIGQPLKASFEA